MQLLLKYSKYLLVVLALMPVPVFAVQYTAGTYTGNGAASQVITTPFQPDVLFVKDKSSQGPGYLFITGMTAGNSSPGDNTAPTTTGITAVAATSFTVGSSNLINKNGDTFNYTAFKNDDGCLTLCTGTYTGSGVQKTITTGFQPAFIMTAPYTGTTADFWYWKTSAFPSNGAMRIGGAAGMQTVEINAFNATTFQIGADGGVNANTVNYAWWGIPATTTVFVTGSASGTSESLFVSTATSSSGNLPMKPNFVLRARASSLGIFSNDTNFDDTWYASKTADSTNRITAMERNGYQVGNSLESNAVGSNYFWLAIGTTSPSFTSIIKGGSTFLGGLLFK